MNAILGIVLAASFSMAAFAADIKPVKQNTRKGKVANLAADIFMVKQVMIGKYAYKVVVMDSRLNGDVNSTSMIIVGEGGVGGGAGYDNAFFMTPVDPHMAITDANVVNGALQVEYFDQDGNQSKKSYIYDPLKKVLSEI